MISVDEKCIDLARHFLSDIALSDDADVDELAQRIQATAETFCDVTFNIPAAPADPRDPDYSRTGMFVLHNCSRCSDGKKPCVVGNPSQCEYPHARND